MSNNPNQHYLKAIMNDPKTSKLIEEAWNAPVGSTKRAQARAIMTSLKRASRNNDGMGGPGDVPSSSSLGYFGPNNFSGKTSFSPVDQNYQNLNTASSMSASTTAIPTILPAAPQDLGINSWNRPSSLPGLALKAGGGLLNLIGSVPGAIGSTVKAGGNAVLGGLANVAGTEYGLGRNLMNWAMSSNYKGTPLNENNPILDFAAGRSQAARDEMLKWPVVQSIAKGQGNRMQTASNTQAATTNGTGPTSTNSQNQGSAPVTEVPPTDQDTEMLPWQSLQTIIQDAVNSGAPASSIAYQVMGNRDLLKKLFPNIPEDQLPAATLAETVKDLEERLKEATGLDDLARQKMNLVNSGNYLVQDLNDYIAGRDEYVKKVDSMIDSVKGKALTNALMTDPQSQRSNEAYLNMLYLLKGQQNKRYLDLVNAASAKYNADMTSLDNEVAVKSNEYQTLLAQDAPIAQEQYNQILNSVVGYIQAYSTAINNGGDPWASTVFNAAAGAASGAADAAKPLDYVKDYPALSQRLSADGGKTLNPVGLPTAIQQLIQEDRVPPKTIYRYLQDMIKTTAANSTDINQLTILKNAMVDLKAADADQIFGVGGVVDSLNKGIVDAMKTPLEGYVTENIPGIKVAINNLISDVKDMNNSAAISRWKNDAQNNQGLSKQFVEALLQAYFNGFRDLRSGQNPNYIFDLSGRNINKLTDVEAISNIVGGIAASWGAEINNVNSGLTYQAPEVQENSQSSRMTMDRNSMFDSSFDPRSKVQWWK